MPDSLWISLEQVPERLDEIPRDKPVITMCGGGNRSQIAASILQNHGIRVLNMKGGISAWKDADYPVEPTQTAAVEGA